MRALGEAETPLWWAIRFMARLFGSAASRLDGLVTTRSVRDATSAHDEAVWRSVAAHDMAAVPDELYFARQYLHWILAELGSRTDATRLNILDLGCGQGRLSLPLAEWCAETGGEVVAVDFAPAAVERGKAYAHARGLKNVTFEQAELLSFVRGLPDGSVDVVLMIEVAFVLPSYREVLREVARVLRPGALAFVAFRSQYFNLLHALHHRRFDSAEMALTRREGHLFDESVWFTWQDPGDVEGLIEDAGLRLLTLRGIGVGSGIAGDPLASIVQPSQLSDEEQERLMAIERAVAEQYVACARYILATAEKTASAASTNGDATPGECRDEIVWGDSGTSG
jgi:SAM-dependent methyltransferase